MDPNRIIRLFTGIGYREKYTLKLYLNETAFLWPVAYSMLHTLSNANLKTDLINRKKWVGQAWR